MLAYILEREAARRSQWPSLRTFDVTPAHVWAQACAAVRADVPLTEFLQNDVAACRCAGAHKGRPYDVTVCDRSGRYTTCPYNVTVFDRSGDHEGRPYEREGFRAGTRPAPTSGDGRYL